MKDKTFGESSASQRAAGFLLSQTLLLNIPHHTLRFPLFPKQERWLRFWLSLPLLFLGSDVMSGSHAALPSPFLFPSLCLY